MSSDKFWGCDIVPLLKWILEEEKKGSIFGIDKSVFFIPGKTDPFRMRRYGHLLETPLGVAAGPHTQLCQNLIAAWLTGARYLELKTVQVLDELEVTKPCIDMNDEGYNCEWSQELKLDQSFDEYLNAWIILHILKDKFGWGDSDEPGFVFNMSAGYNLEGILSPSVQRFLDQMADCSQAKEEKLERLAAIYPRVRELDIADCISDNITISTMHGCPPDEVEKIGRYFVKERKLNTTIKLNPTLLGPERLRGILNDSLGFETVVPDLAFEHDLKYEDGLALIRALIEDARQSGVAFNIKLTNTLETANKEQNLPKNETMVYMSGRALHPISVNLAAKLQSEFNGELDISFSAGVDCFNFAGAIACNLKPITVCSDILKPGGYARLSQYLELLGAAMNTVNAQSIEEFITSRCTDTQTVDPARAGLENLKSYAAKVIEDKAYKKEQFAYESIKTQRKLDNFDCIQAPCMTTCPAGQDIPGYLYHTARGDYEKAYRTIMQTNPFAHVQGMVCDHLCQNKCTRINYDNPLLIREIKRFVAEKFEAPGHLKPLPSNGIKVAVIGAGPSGLACAYFLSLEGFEVEIFESKAFAGGWASDAIPEFRLDNGSIQKDIDAILKLGVTIHYESAVDQKKFQELQGNFKFIYIAVGAQQGTKLGIPGEDAQGVMDQLEFLSAVRRGQRPDLGKNVVVIGGGNSAMDAARTAKRLVGASGKVSVIYRRTRKQMPAAPEEIQALADESIKLIELTAPECMLVEQGRVKSNLCFCMELGEKDASGRRRPIKIEGSEFELDADTVISAIGQQVKVDFFPHQKLEINPATHETQVSNVFAGGDAVRGASTLIKAIGDGKKAAASIIDRALHKDRLHVTEPEENKLEPELVKQKGRRLPGASIPETGFDQRRGFDLVVHTMDEQAVRKEAARCLQCSQVCNVCVSVCPNRANVAYSIEPVEYPVQQARQTDNGVEVLTVQTAHISQRRQVLNLADYCNECGNCTTFCPTSGSPYLNKPKLHLSRDSYQSASFGYHFSSANRLEYKRDGSFASLEITGRGYIFENDQVCVELTGNYIVKQVEFKKKITGAVNLQMAAQMAILAFHVSRVEPFNSIF
ncbi:MAG: putative selenate reductase subunit YgfK [Desulfobacteraceae bacterium]|nr:putative selenate reductase subunit YgfK [Desulfobacteraceae bacterium]